MADNLGPMAWLFLPENELPIASLGRDRREQGSTFSGQVSAIEARDAAIFTKNNVKSLANSKML